MTLTTLLIRIAFVAILFTILSYLDKILKSFRKDDEILEGSTLEEEIISAEKNGNKIINTNSLLMTFLQHFCGVLFVFSGMVKAVDPLGTAYKMEQYFDEFYFHFEPTWFGFLAPLFPILSSYAIWFSVFMIVFEIVLGLMLIMGSRTKFTAWAFLLLVLFFTVLTGFTFLTGYVPSGATFFEFGKWAAYDANNMKVTDCGCFGDFIKLVPKTSFLKDIFLLFPAFYFLFRHKDMHQMFNKPIRTGIIGLSIIGLLLYCFSNFVWDIPGQDFRPFKKGTDVRAVKEAEDNAMAAVQITGWKLKNNETGEESIVPNKEYMANYSTKYKGVYKVIDQIKGEPTIKPTKISEFEIESLDGYDLAEELVQNPEAQFLIVNYELKGDPIRKTKMVKDSIFNVDTIMVMDLETNLEKASLVKSFDRIEEKEVAYVDQNWDPEYIATHIEKLKPFTEAAKKTGIPVMMAIGKSDPDAIAEFDKATGLALRYGMADDILLKTIVRSNPGIVLWKDGIILDKWHINKLPDFSQVQSQYLK